MKPIFRGLGHRSFVSQVRFDEYYMCEQIKLKAKSEKMPELKELAGDTTPKLMRRNSKNVTISQLVRQSTFQELKKHPHIGREYRLITGGDDGMIMWWNIPYSPEKPADPIDSLVVFADPS